MTEARSTIANFPTKKARLSQIGVKSHTLHRCATWLAVFLLPGSVREGCDDDAKRRSNM
jgi:hypothetical protein